VKRRLLSSRDLSDVPEQVRVGSPLDASDRVVRKLARKGVLHPQTNFSVVYRIAFAPRLIVSERPLMLRWVHITAAPIDGSERRLPSNDDGGWLLLTTWGLRWHLMVDGVPGSTPHPEAPRPPGPRNGAFTDVSWETPARSHIVLGHGPMGPATIELAALADRSGSGWLFRVGLAPGAETKDLFRIHPRAGSRVSSEPT